MYFVNAILNDSDDEYDDEGILGEHTRRGIVIGSQRQGLVLAHEICHEIGLCDIYSSRKGVSVGTACVCFDHMAFDWNNGCIGTGSQPGARYYAEGLTQASALKRLLMNGSAYGGTDIPFEMVWGVRQRAGDFLCETNQVDVGAFAPSRSFQGLEHE